MNDDVFKRDTSTFNNYKWLAINYPTHGKSQPLILEFLHYLDSNYFANSTNKNPLAYFVKFEKFADGELGELYTDFYLRLFNYNTCDFFQLMKVRKENMTKNEFEDLSLLDLVFQEINHETMNKKKDMNHYFDSLKIVLFSDKQMKKVVYTIGKELNSWR